MKMMRMLQLHPIGARVRFSVQCNFYIVHLWARQTLARAPLWDFSQQGEHGGGVDGPEGDIAHVRSGRHI